MQTATSGPQARLALDERLASSKCCLFTKYLIYIYIYYIYMFFQKCRASNKSVLSWNHESVSGAFLFLSIRMLCFQKKINAAILYVSRVT